MTNRLPAAPGRPADLAASRGHTAPSILLLDDHRLFAESLAFALRLLGLACLRADRDRVPATDLAALIRRSGAGVVVLSLPHPVSRPTPIVAACRAARARVLVISGPRDPSLEADALHAGAEAVLDRAQAFDDLARALFVTIVTQSEAIGPRRSGNGTDGGRDAALRGDALAALTPREREVLGCLMDGMTADDIARRESISIATVRSHVHAILTKLGVNCQLAAVAAAHRAGWSPNASIAG